MSNTIKKTTVEKIASRKHYYSFYNNKHELVTDIEEIFSSVESDFIKFREQLRSVIENINRTGRVHSIEPRYRTTICEYVKLNFIKIPKIMDWVYEETKKHEESVSSELKTTFSEYHYKNLSIKILLSFLMPREPDIVKVLFDRDISFEYFGRTKGSLVTSDNPVIRFNTNKLPGLIYSDTHVIFPIDRNKYLRFFKSDRNDKIIRITNYDVIKEINDFEYENAVEEVYGPSKEILEELIERGMSRRTIAST